VEQKPEVPDGCILHTSVGLVAALAELTGRARTLSAIAAAASEKNALRIFLLVHSLAGTSQSAVPAVLGRDEIIAAAAEGCQADRDRLILV
jgi:hypothetical protein